MKLIKFFLTSSLILYCYSATAQMSYPFVLKRYPYYFNVNIGISNGATPAFSGNFGYAFDTGFAIEAGYTLLKSTGRPLVRGTGVGDIAIKLGYRIDLVEAYLKAGPAYMTNPGRTTFLLGLGIDYLFTENVAALVEFNDFFPTTMTNNRYVITAGLMFKF